jgi:hypothetical protein
MSPRPHLLLRAPTPSQLSLTFCDATPRDLKRWIAKLPKANLGETARLLYQGLGELNQLLTPSDNRLQMLELLRPEVYFVCKHLERHFLNQSIVLDERSRKVANLCQALQNHLAVGYKQIVLRISSKYSKDRAPLLATAAQRALHCLNGPVVRASLLYCPVPDGVWLELHQLYQAASAHQLQNMPISDPLAGNGRTLTVQQSYAATLLLGSSRCNQMRQHAILRLAEVLDAWSALARVQPATMPSSLFAMVPDEDSPPRYTTLYDDDQLAALVGLDPTDLVQAIRQYLEMPVEQRAQSRLITGNFSIDLLQHVAAAWGDVAERTFTRTPGQGNLTLCIGMSALHYYIGGERSFSEILKRPAMPQSAQFVPGAATQSWSRAENDRQNDYEEIQYDLPRSEGSSASVTSNHDQHYPTYALQIVNHSPGGYCLAWPREVPPQLQAGEMVGIQDTQSQGWSVAVVRWIRQVRSGGTQMGIELVAPHAQPCGLQLVRVSEQNSQFLRGLLLPEIRAIDIPASLLAPRMPFQEGNKVIINTQGEERPAGLGLKMTSTGSFNQFEYHLLEVPKPSPAADDAAPEEDFDSLWKDL